MQKFSDITIPGETEHKQAIPPRPGSADELIHGLFPTDSPYSTFFRDMQKFVLTEGKPAEFVPFNLYLPTYEQMSKRQQAWYFYWRDQVRQGNYVDTDLSYIYLLIYEILSGVGWRTPQEGYEYLSQLLLKYQDKFPTLILNLPDWTFDFAESYGLEHTLFCKSDSTYLSSLTKIDILVEQHADDLPLTLPFTLIDALCDYSIVQSPFYNDGNQKVMEETIPRVLSLTDAVLRKGTQMGFLQTYGPEHPEKQGYYAFRNALCPRADKKIKVSVRAYSTNQRLREHITELVRYTEHALWELKGHYDHLTIDHEIAKLVTLFLRHEYGQISAKITVKNGEFVLPEEIDTFPAPYIPISDNVEHRQIISPQTVPTCELVHTSFLRNYTENEFFIDMLHYASFEGEPATFVPFDMSRPTYEDMNRQQRAWYFYWRSQMRQDNYLETDLSYILLYTYEIINGVGWRAPQKGYEYLLRIMLEYQNKFSYLDHYLPDWIFDFAQLHGIKHTQSLEGRSIDFIPHPKLNLLIKQHAEDVPLKLPFALIERLCTHSFQKSEFYNDGNEALIQEAIPRVVALADAILRKKTNVGFLQTYGPEHTRRLKYHTFKEAHCLKSNKIINIAVKLYTTNAVLIYQITELARYTENILRELEGYRDRLKGITIDHETAKVIGLFLRSEYGQMGSKNEKLDFDDIDTFLAPYITISDKAEHKQIISPRTMPTYELIHSSFLKNYSENNFFIDMLTYASFEGERAPFVPFDTPQPTYKDMNMQQQAWYFYWRSQVRQDNYLDTDLSYIFLYIYEIINGVGWRVPQKGYECLLRIMSEYQNRFPHLNRYVPDWTFDFAQLHGIKHTLALEGRSIHFLPDPKVNVLIDQHADDIPLKLPFELIESLCNLSYEKNKFYAGNKALIWEAIPRTVSLVDAFLRKKTKIGLLQTYGPDFSMEQDYYAFEKAYCLRSNRIVTVIVKPYTVGDRLKSHMTGLVRYSENMLRDIKGYRSRLYGDWVNAEIAKVVKSFLNQEYGEHSSKAKSTEKVEITLNFKDIAILREQSDAVRAALEVEDATLPIENEANENQPQLLEMETVSTLFDTSELSDTVREFIEYLTPLQQKALHTMLAYEHPEHELEQIAEEAMTMPQILLDEINETALQILGDLVVESMDQEFRVLDEYVLHLKQSII